MSEEEKQEQIRYLQERVDYLEQVNRLTIDALDLAVSLGQIKRSIKEFDSETAILANASKRIQRLMPFEFVCFYIVDEKDSSFKQGFCSPDDSADYMQHQLDTLIESRMLAWAIDQNRPIVVPDDKREKQLLIHALETSKRTRGVFVGVPKIDEHKISDVTLSIFSIIIHGTAYVLESYELYKWAKDLHSSLTDKINELVSSEQKLRRSEILLKDAQHITKTGCWEYNYKTEEMYWSDELYMLLGYLPGEVLPSLGKFFDHIHHDDYQPFLFDRKGKYEFDQPVVTDEFHIVTNDGQEKIIFSQMKYERSDSGEAIFLRGTMQDFTDQRREEKEREQIHLQLQRAEKMETVGVLAGGVAHDLNNILGAVVGYPDLLLRDIPKDSKLVKPLQIISESGQRAASIVNDLLTLARRRVNVSEVININDIIKEYLSSYQFEKLKEYHPELTISANFEAQPCNIMGSSVHILKAVMNLVSNAAESMHNGGSVIISTKRASVTDPIKGYDHISKGEYIVVSVTDTGVGISKEDMRKIFEPFYTKKVMGRSGTGLGMAVVWNTVKDHKGYIDITSSSEKGTRFDLYFPVTDRVVTLDKEPLPLQEYTGKGQTILVVDDVEEQRELALLFLRALEYQAEAVSSGEQALDYLKQKPVDLVVLDMIMDPGMDGLETYQKILTIRPNQKAIIVSGFSETDRIKEALKLGAGQYIKKPYTIEQLGLALAEELKK